VIRVNSLKHNKQGSKWSGVNPENYRIKDDIEVHADIVTLEDGKWVPFQAKDVQLNFVMLDPLYIKTLEKSEKTSPTFST
jgi:oligosaccharyltransferase complex subunit beta